MLDTSPSRLRRYVPRLIDVWFVLCFLQLTESVIPAISRERITADALLTNLAGILLSALYLVANWSTTGKTGGARLTKLRLVSGPDGRVPLGASTVRCLGLAFVVLAFYLGASLGSAVTVVTPILYVGGLLCASFFMAYFDRLANIRVIRD